MLNRKLKSCVCELSFGGNNNAINTLLIKLINHRIKSRINSIP